MNGGDLQNSPHIIRQDAGQGGNAEMESETELDDLMGSIELRRKLQYRPPPSTSPSSSAAAAAAAKRQTAEDEEEAAPPSFLCPISRKLMADPVVVAATGWTFERSCIQACADLGFGPPDLSLPLDSAASSSSSSSPLILIPNVTLRSAILNWSKSRGLPYPLAVPPDEARALVRSLMSSRSAGPPSPSAGLDGKGETLGTPANGDDQVLPPKALSHGGDDEKDRILAASTLSRGSNKEAENALCSESSELDVNRRDGMSSVTPDPIFLSSFSQPSTSSAPSSAGVAVHGQQNQEITKAAILPATDILSPASREIDAEARIFSPRNIPLPIVPEIEESEEESITDSLDADVNKQEAAAVSFRQATRVNRDCRLELCKPRKLAALRSMLLSCHATVQVNAVAALVNISLEPENKVPIVRCGAALPLVDLLKSGHPEAREHAAAAFFSLALVDESRVTIGSLGAIPPLFNLFARTPTASPRARRDAGKALYYLTLANPNRHRVAHTAGAARALLSVAAAGAEAEASPQQQGPGPARLAMMVVSNLAACGDGRTALMDAGAVSAVVTLMESCTAAMEEHCMAVLYGMSRDRLRFPGLARAAQAEQILERVAKGGSGDIRQKMARKMLRTMRRQDEEEKDGGGSSAVAGAGGFPAPVNHDSNAVSDGLMSFRHRYKFSGDGSDIKSSPF